MKLVDLDNLGIAKADIEILGNASYVYGWNSALQVVAETSHTIDPETLPIVQELRGKIKLLEYQHDLDKNGFEHLEKKYNSLLGGVCGNQKAV